MENIKHPYHDYSLQDALRLAQMEAALEAGHPVYPKDFPVPSISRAIELVKWRQKTCGHVWITGAVALELLRSANGEDVRFTPCS